MWQCAKNNFSPSAKQSGGPDFIQYKMIGQCASMCLSFSQPCFHGQEIVRMLASPCYHSPWLKPQSCSPWKGPETNWSFRSCFIHGSDRGSCLVRWWPWPFQQRGADISTFAIDTDNCKVFAARHFVQFSICFAFARDTFKNWAIQSCPVAGGCRCCVRKLQDASPFLCIFAEGK